MYQVILNTKKQSNHKIYDTLVRGVHYVRPSGLVKSFISSLCYNRNHYDLQFEFYHLINLSSISERNKTIKNPSMMGLRDLYKYEIIAWI
jgi:hypothetical protein